MSLNVDTKLQHCKLKWTIKNFRMRRQPKESMESPIYELKSWFASKWKIVLEFNEKNGDIYTSVILKLCEISNDIKELQVRCRLSLFIRSLIEFEKRRLFQIDDSLAFKDFATLYEVNESSFVILEDSFTVQIEVLVKDPRTFSMSVIDKHLLALSNDLKKLYERQIYSDMVISSHGKQFDAHMCIFQARCSNARRLLRDDDRTIANVYSSKPYVVERLIYFMYTGDIYSVLNDPIIGMTECAQEFGIVDLERITKPDSIAANTIIKVQKCTFSWMIENVTDLMENRNILFTRPLVNEGKQSVLWNLQIVSHKDHLSIYADVREFQEDLGVCFEVCILDDKDQKCVTKETFHFENGRCGFPALVDWEYLHKHPNLLTNDTLRLKFTIKYSMGILEVPMDREFTLRSNANYCKTFKTLSDNLLSLFTDGNNSDMPFIVNGETFALHKAIVACRSDALNSMLECNQGDSFIMEEVDIVAFKALMRYIYGGVHGEMAVNVALQVYLKSHSYNLTHLTRECSIILSKLLTVESLYTVLIRTWNSSDEELQKTLVKFIYLHSDEIFTRHDWRRFRDKLPMSHALVMDAVYKIASELETIIHGKA